MFGPNSCYRNPTRQPNAYLGDAVARAKYKKEREEWERSGRRGPPPRRPSGQEAPVLRNPTLCEKVTEQLALEVQAEMDGARTVGSEGNPSRISRTRGVKTMRGPYEDESPWIQHPGTLGEGFLTSMSKDEREEALDLCVAEHGYRSCLGKIMVLERAKKGPRGKGKGVGAKYAKKLKQSREYLVDNFGGPGSFGPRREERRLRAANPSAEKHYRSAMFRMQVAQEEYSRGKTYWIRAEKAEHPVRDAQIAFDHFVEAQRQAYFASDEFNMIGEPERRDAASRLGGRAFDKILHIARQYNVRISQPYPNPPSHVHRGVGGDLLTQASHYLAVAEDAEENGKMGEAWNAVRHAECDLRMAYTELAYAGGATPAELLKLEDAYKAVQGQKDRLVKKRRGNPRSFTNAECKVGRTYLELALANGTFDLDYTFWANENKAAYRAVQKLLKSGHLKLVWADSRQITAEPTSKGWGEFVLYCT